MKQNKYVTVHRYHPKEALYKKKEKSYETVVFD